jgi:hypothetical protein
MIVYADLVGQEHLIEILQGAVAATWVGSRCAPRRRVGTEVGGYHRHRQGLLVLSGFIK